MLIAKLAVDTRYQGNGLGRLTLTHALSLLSHSSVTIGFELVLVDAIDTNAAKFYERFGFRPLVDGEERLFLTTADLRKTLEEGSQ